MKTITRAILISFVFGFFLSASVTYAESSWQLVGKSGISSGKAVLPTITFDASGAPFVGFEDQSVSRQEKITVMKFNGVNWIDVTANGLSQSYVSEPVFTRDTSGTPWIAFTDTRMGLSKPTVMKYVGTQWVNVGNPSFSNRDARFIAFTLDPLNTPYVAFQDSTYGCGSPYSYGLTVMKYNGVNWVPVGEPCMSIGPVQDIALAVDKSNVLHIAYYQNHAGEEAVVMKFIGDTWERVTNTPFTDQNFADTKIAFDSSNNLFIAYSTFGKDKVNVKKLSGKSWISVGLPDFATADFVSLDFALDPTGTPYVAFASGEKVTVMKFNGTQWVNVGAPSFSTSYTDIAISPSGVPYVAFSDEKNDNKISVIKFALSGQQSISLMPSVVPVTPMEIAKSGTEKTPEIIEDKKNVTGEATAEVTSEVASEPTPALQKKGFFQRLWEFFFGPSYKEDARIALTGTKSCPPESRSSRSTTQILVCPSAILVDGKYYVVNLREGDFPPTDYSGSLTIEGTYKKIRGRYTEETHGKKFKKVKGLLNDAVIIERQ